MDRPGNNAAAHITENVFNDSMEHLKKSPYIHHAEQV
jgi:hypothetical protein